MCFHLHNSLQKYYSISSYYTLGGVSIGHTLGIGKYAQTLHDQLVCFLNDIPPSSKSLYYIRNPNAMLYEVDTQRMRKLYAIFSLTHLRKGYKGENLKMQFYTLMSFLISYLGVSQAVAKLNIALVICIHTTA